MKDSDWEGLAMNTAIVVALLGLASAVVVAGIGGLVTYLGNRARVRTAADEAVDATARAAADDKEEAMMQRLAFKDELLAHEKEVSAGLRLRIVNLEADNARLQRMLGDDRGR